MALWLKVFGDINMSDIQDDIKSMLYTNWLQFQGEGNIDANNPLNVRFFVPPNTKEISSANLNIITGKYRVDSDITSTAPSSQVAVATTSESGGGINIQDVPTLSTFIDVAPDPAFPSHTETSMAVVGTDDYSSDGSMHFHRIAHSYLKHHHYFAVASDGHTHNINATIDIDGHSHELNMGIKVADTVPSNVKCYVENSNGSFYLNFALNGDNQTKNNVDIKEFLKVGEWNTIKITADNISRVTVFGIAELLQNYK
jgi:hypothetical protein